MDTLQSLSGYYTRQDYAPIPLPTYSAPTFPTPSPYLRTQPSQANSRLTPTRINPEPTQPTAPAHCTSTASGAEASATRKKDGAPRGFGRTSAVYQTDSSGVKHRVSAEDFRAEVEERTRNGESCEQIADALIARGAQVTSKSISRWRIQWGFRKRAVRKQSKPAKPKEERTNKKQTAQLQFKADITRMTQQGLGVDDITRIMTARGMELKKGPSTISRLQTIWKLRGSEENRIKNKRYLSRRKARQQQLDEFRNYAKELGLENLNEWVRNKMEEPAIKKMRRDAAIELMGDAAPVPKQSIPTKSKHSGGDADRTRGYASAAVDRATEIEESSDDELTADISTRALRSGLMVPDRSAARQSLADGLVEENGNSSSGGFQNNEQSTDENEDENFQPLLEQDDDDDDDLDVETDTPNLAAQNQTSDRANIFTASTMEYVPSPPPPPPPPEEEDVELIRIADDCIAAAQRVRELLLAKSAGRPSSRRIAGLPPSAKEITEARRGLKNAALATARIL